MGNYRLHTMKVRHITFLVLCCSKTFAFSENLDYLSDEAVENNHSKSLISNLRRLTFEVFPKTLREQRIMLEKLRLGKTKYQKSQVQALEDAKLKAEQELKVETEKRVAFENLYKVEKELFSQSMNSLQLELGNLREKFEELKARNDKTHDTWFDESDDHTHANAFVESYSKEFKNDFEKKKNSESTGEEEQVVSNSEQ